MKKLLFTLVFAFFGLVSFSQTAEVGLLGGLSYYLGDLNPGIHFLGSRPAWGAVARVNLDNRWVARASFTRARVKGDDSMGNTNDQRGLKFESRITDIALTAEFNFFDYFTGSRKNVMAPYIFGGIGMVIFDPRADGVSLRSMGTEGQNVGFDGRKPYSRVAFTIPFGLGLKYSLSRRLAFSAEWGMRKTFTDYLDDVSTIYVDRNLLAQKKGQAAVNFAYRGDELANGDPYPVEGTKRGNPANDDWYYVAGISMRFRIVPKGRKRDDTYKPRRASVACPKPF